MTEGARVLLVEDDDNLRLTLADVLRDNGYSVAAAADVASASSMLASASFDVVILDVMLPDGDGYSLCADIKKRALASRVLMLTARTLEDDLVRGFDAGADDYLKKPYRLRELLVRVRALARRGGAPATANDAGDAVALGGVTIDRTGRRVLDEGGNEIAMTKTELDLLLLFVDSAGVALSRNHILDRVWGKDVVVDERTVDNFVSSLKKKLRWTPSSPFSIRTVRGVGYRMELS
ncbi:MAG TPA: response regulator transcription factor [Myxococcota bacterium]